MSDQTYFVMLETYKSLEIEVHSENFLLENRNRWKNKVSNRFLFFFFIIFLLTFLLCYLITDYIFTSDFTLFSCFFVNWLRWLHINASFNASTAQIRALLQLRTSLRDLYFFKSTFGFMPKGHNQTLTPKRFSPTPQELRPLKDH